LTRLKKAIKEWVKSSYKVPQEEIFRLRGHLEEIGNKLEHLEVTISLLQEEGKCQKKLQEVMRKEEETWRLKSLCLWLQVGDIKSSFHKQCRVRKGHKLVEEIHLEENSILISFEEIKFAALEHFSYLYMERGPVDRELKEQSFSFIPTLVTKSENEELIKRVSKEETLSSLAQFDPDKDPGPDGSMVHFYKKCWNIIKHDLVRMIQYVQKSRKVDGATNSTFLALIPKERKCVSFSIFRPVISPGKSPRL